MPVHRALPRLNKPDEEPARGERPPGEGSGEMHKTADRSLLECFCETAGKTLTKSKLVTSR